jgi:hypothetical protein
MKKGISSLHSADRDNMLIDFLRAELDEYLETEDSGLSESIELLRGLKEPCGPRAPTLTERIAMKVFEGSKDDPQSLVSGLKNMAKSTDKKGA